MTRLENYLQNLQRFGIQPGLERIQALLESAGNPQNSYPIMLVGGTNGKGSTCEFAARLLAQDGRRIGLYTSPHLYNWNERIRILPGDGLFEGAISDADLDALLDDALPHIETVARELGQPTEFEVMTFLGLWHFSRQKVDAAVVEVGLGGKWDATNATEPIVSVVTHVALDHMDRLGNTLEEIAADKVEIARAGRYFITAETKKSVLNVFK
ncbi:MAG TPA: Mur ligase family protein, partial [Abditibacterium sp.]